jgi:hypothetical protein
MYLLNSLYWNTPSSCLNMFAWKIRTDRLHIFVLDYIPADGGHIDKKSLLECIC